MDGSVQSSTHAVSVIVPTIGRWDTVAHLLADLDLAAVMANLEVEVLVVGDGMDVATVERELPIPRGARIVVRLFGLRVRSGAAAARNLGISRASAPTLVFLDDDVRVTGGWAGALRAIIEAGWTCATGPVTSHDTSLLSRAREDRYRRRYEGLATGDPVGFFAGGNSVICTAVLRSVDGFPEIPVGSDTAMLARIEPTGHVCRFAADLRVSHTHDRGWRTALETAWRSGRTATSAGVRAEAASLRRALPSAGAIGAVNAVLLTAKFGGLLTSARRQSR